MRRGFSEAAGRLKRCSKRLKATGLIIVDTHLSDPDKIDKLYVVVSIAFSWVYKTSIYIYKYVKPIAIKTHNRKAYSYFKYGFHFLTNALLVNPHKLIIFSNVLPGT